MLGLFGLLNMLVAAICKPVTCKTHRRSSTWSRYAPVALSITFILLIIGHVKHNTSNRIHVEEVTEDFQDVELDYKKALLKPSTVNLASLKSGITIHIVMGLLFVSRDPHAAANAKDTITWILVYSTAPVHFHVLSDGSSKEVIETIMLKAGQQANCPFTYTIDDLEHLYDPLIAALNENIPNLKLHMLQEHVLTQMLPLTLQWFYKDLKRAVMVSPTLKFRGNIVDLYEHFDQFKEGQVLGLSLAQNAKFATAFTMHRHTQADDKLGLPSPDGWPGFNTDLLLLDFERMRNSGTFKRYIDLENQLSIIKKYEFAGEGLLPLLDEWLTLVGLEKPELFYLIPCEWNVQLMTVMNPALYYKCPNDVQAMHFLE